MSGISRHTGEFKNNAAHCMCLKRGQNDQTTLKNKTDIINSFRTSLRLEIIKTGCHENIFVLIRKNCTHLYKFPYQDEQILFSSNIPFYDLGQIN